MANILVDTSVWINHIKSKNENLAEILERGIVRTHPLIIGEMACGTLSNRKQTIEMFNKIMQVKQASNTDVLTFIENEKLYGYGCGIVDITILASTLITPNTELWTADKRFKALAERFGVMYKPTVH